MAAEIQVVKVRHCSVDDLAAVLSIHVRQRSRPDGSPTDVESSTWDEMMRSPRLTVYLAELAGIPVGTASMMLMPNLTYSCAPTAFIEGVAVVEESRRMGVATSMLRLALIEAAEAGVDKVQIVAHKRHATDGAHALYMALGFEAEAEGFRRYIRSAR